MLEPQTHDYPGLTVVRSELLGDKLRAHADGRLQASTPQEAGRGSENADDVCRLHGPPCHRHRQRSAHLQGNHDRGSEAVASARPVHHGDGQHPGPQIQVPIEAAQTDAEDRSYERRRDGAIATGRRVR